MDFLAVARNRWTIIWTMTSPVTITSERVNYFDFRNFALEHVERLASEFKLAKPFPHVVLQNFLKLTMDEMSGVYPTPDWPHWNKRLDFYQSGKMYFRDTDIM